MMPMPWQLLIDQIEPFYPKTGSKGGRPPLPVGDHAPDSPDEAVVLAECALAKCVDPPGRFSCLESSKH
jgi:hypothetical protein